MYCSVNFVSLWTTAFCILHKSILIWYRFSKNNYTNDSYFQFSINGIWKQYDIFIFIRLHFFFNSAYFFSSMYCSYSNYSFPSNHLPLELTHSPLHIIHQELLMNGSNDRLSQIHLPWSDIFRYMILERSFSIKRNL